MVDSVSTGLGSKLRHRPEMVDSVSTNRVHVTYWPSPPFPVRDVVLITGLLLIFLHSCEIKPGSGLGTRLPQNTVLFAVHIFATLVLRFYHKSNSRKCMGVDGEALQLHSVYKKLLLQVM